MSIWTKIFRKSNQDKETIIVLSIADNLKVFKSIDDAILYLQKSDNKELIPELQKLRYRIYGNRTVKAVRITEDNEIIEYDDLEALKRDSK